MRAINVKLNEDALQTLRLWRIEGGLTLSQVVELALEKLKGDQPPSRVAKEQQLSLDI